MVDGINKISDDSIKASMVLKLWMMLVLKLIWHDVSTKVNKNSLQKEKGSFTSGISDSLQAIIFSQLLMFYLFE